MTSACSGPGATPNLRHLMLFDQVVRRGSVSAAARTAHLSQPAVTQAVAQVEAALGARLLHRSYSGLELTGAGRGAAQRVDRALQMLRDALGAVRGVGVRPAREAGKLAWRARLALVEIAQARAGVAAAQGDGSGSTTIGAMPLARSVLLAGAVLEFSAAGLEDWISILDGPNE